MAEDLFEALDPLLETGNPTQSLDFLISRFREQKNYALVFEARLMKSRAAFGLGAFLNTALGPSTTGMPSAG